MIGLQTPRSARRRSAMKKIAEDIVLVFDDGTDCLFRCLEHSKFIAINSTPAHLLVCLSLNLSRAGAVEVVPNSL